MSNSHTELFSPVFSPLSVTSLQPWLSSLTLGFLFPRTQKRGVTFIFPGCIPALGGQKIRTWLLIMIDVDPLHLPTSSKITGSPNGTALQVSFHSLSETQDLMGPLKDQLTFSGISVSVTAPWWLLLWLCHSCSFARPRGTIHTIQWSVPSAAVKKTTLAALTLVSPFPTRSLLAPRWAPRSLSWSH